MILGASDRSVVAGTRLWSGCRPLLAGQASVGGGGEREGTWAWSHSSSALPTGEKVLQDDEFTCDLFRFLQLLCEGHNSDFQNYLRTQTGNNTTVNIIISTVDYLLRVQESISDFYWYYSGKDIIDEQGQRNFSKAIQVAKQVFNTLTEYIQ
ncbi:hypothetical protein U0070_022596, partial [Myodes glareolus]